MNLFKQSAVTTIIPKPKKYVLVKLPLKFNRFDFEKNLPEDKNDPLYNTFMDIIQHEKNPSYDSIFKYMLKGSQVRYYKEIVNVLVRDLFNKTPIDIDLCPKEDAPTISFTLDLPIDGIEDKINNADLDRLFYIPGFAGDVLSYPSKTNPEIILGCN